MVVKIANQNIDDLYIESLVFKTSFPKRAPTIIPDIDSGKVLKRAAFI